MFLIARALAFVALFAAAVVGAEPPALYPCLALYRTGAVDVSGAVVRPDRDLDGRECDHRFDAGGCKPAKVDLAERMASHCDFVVLGRFANVSDGHYDEQVWWSWDKPVLATFQVSEALSGDAPRAFVIRVQRDMLAAPGEGISRLLRHRIDAAEDLRRQEIVDEMSTEVESIREAGGPMTDAQYERLTEALRRLAREPARSRYDLHQVAVDGVFRSRPTLTFHAELGAIRPAERFLLGLRKEPVGIDHLDTITPLNTFVLWGQEAEDVAAEARRIRDR